MDLPKIELAGLPDLDVLTGAFGSLGPLLSQNDSIIILATYIYEVIPPGG
jgi:hypothetical protein